MGRASFEQNQSRQICVNPYDQEFEKKVRSTRRSQQGIKFDDFLKIIDHYQEQPHVIDAYLEEMIAALLAKGRKKDNTDLLTNQAFTYIYLITKMRGYKVVIRYFPHEVSDLAPILAMLEVREIMCFLAESWDRSAILL